MKLRGCYVKRGDEEVAVELEHVKAGEVFRLTPASPEDVQCDTRWYLAKQDAFPCPPEGNVGVEAELVV